MNTKYIKLNILHSKPKDEKLYDLGLETDIDDYYLEYYFNPNQIICMYKNDLGTTLIVTGDSFVCKESIEDILQLIAKQ